MVKSWKIFVFLLVLLFGSFLYSAETDGKTKIGVLKVVGNKSISSNRVLTKVRVRVGDEFNEIIANEDCKRIAELDGVEYCYYNTTEVDGKLELSYVVVERHITRSLVFVGNSRIKEKILKRKLDFKVGDYVDSVIAQKGAEDLIEYYKKKGYWFAVVSYDEEKLPVGKVVYNITEGPRSRIVAVNFKGNDSIKDSKLKSGLKTKPKKFLVLNKYYDEEEIEGDVAKLQQKYSKRGFLDTKIEQQVSFNEDKSRVTVDFVIQEGQVYNLRTLTFTGNKYFSEEILREGFKLVEGEMYSEVKSKYDVKSILAHYKSIGFVDATVEEGRSLLEGNLVDIEFTITEGQRYRIGLVNVSGNEDTQDKVVRQILNEYDFVPGEWYNADEAAGDGDGYLERKIKHAALAESVIITPVDSTYEGHKDAKVDITEGQTGSILLGAGVSSNSGAVGQLVYQQRNFDSKDKPENWGEFLTGKAYKGAGQNLRIALEPGTEVSQYSVSFVEPYFLDKPISLNIVGSSWEREQECYDEQRIKGYLGFEKRYKDNWRRSIAFRVEQVDLSSVDSDAPKEVYDDEGKSFLGGVRLGFGKDTTDDDWNPSKGYMFDVTYEQVGGDYTFGVLRGTYRRYKTIHEDIDERKTVWGIKLEAGSIVGNAPVFEKFYAGGQGSIRGFDYRGVSPRGKSTNNGNPVAGAREDDPIGSDWIILANTEVTIPIFSENFALMLFVDSGMVETGGYRAAVGTGLQIMLPQWFGPVPMRFSVATPVMKDGNDDTQLFSFSVGRLF